MKDTGKILVSAILAAILISMIVPVAESISYVNRPPMSYMAKVHVNVTYPGGNPARYVYLSLHRYDHSYTHYYSETGMTDSNGKETLDVTYRNLGPCYLTVYNSSRSSFSRTRLHVWPGDEIYVDFILEPSLPDYNTISGVVYNGSGDDPAPSPTEVKLSGTDETGLEFERVNTTTPEGEYLITFPNSTTPLRLNAEVKASDVDFLSYGSDISPVEDQHSYRMDIHLTPEGVGETQVDLRLVNSTSGRPIDKNDYFKYTGFKAFEDHEPMGWEYVYTSSSEGWRNTTRGKGEYICTWEHRYQDPLNTMVSAEIPITVNETDISREVHIPVPDQFHRVNVEIVDQDDGTPIRDSSVSFSYHVREKGEPRFQLQNTYLASNTSGMASFSLLEGCTVELSFFRWDYVAKTITIEAGPAGESTDLEVDMKKRDDPYTRYGNLSVKVVDPLTETPIPYADVKGTGSGEHSHLYFKGMTVGNGYFNRTVEVGEYFIEAGSPLGSGSIKNLSVTEEENASAEIGLERRTFEETRYGIDFTLISPFGNPVPYAPVSFAPIGSGDYLTTGSDGDGEVRAILSPGDYRIENRDSYGHYSIFRPHWIIPSGTKITVPDDDITELTVYPAGELQEVKGAILNSETGDPIPYAVVETESYWPLNTRAFHGTMDTEGVSLYEQTSGSENDGFYRIWGTGSVLIECEVEDYFPYGHTIDLTTRSQHSHDILLEPMKEYTTWFNGTIVDSGDQPIEGSVELYDIERDDFHVGTNMTPADGTFSIETYPGTFRVRYHNMTLENTRIIEIPPSGLEDFLLRLVPLSKIEGVVLGESGDPVPNLNVSLIRKGLDANVTVDFMTTDSGGNFSFMAPAGTYYIKTNGTVLYSPVKSGLLVATGYNEFDLELKMEFRTTADLNGMVLSSGGPLSGGMPDVFLTLLKLDEPIPYDGPPEGGIIEATTTTDGDGEFHFQNVGHGDNYYIDAFPPPDLRASEEFYRSGYLPNTTDFIDVSGISVNIEIRLQYAFYDPPGYFDITGRSPQGSDVLLDEVIRIRFSDPVNRTALPICLDIEPDPGNITYVYDPVGYSVEIHHDDFLPSTLYSVEISRDLLSVDDLKLNSSATRRWSFTTGTERGSWRITGSFVDVDLRKNWEIVATGPGGQDVYFIIEGVGSYELEGHPIDDMRSEYRGFIDGDPFEWNTTYAFHYSDSDNGLDMAVEFSGWVRTVTGPYSGIKEWKLTGVDVHMDDDGDWEVEAEGNGNLSVYFVIDGGGSFLLDEISPGVYTTTVPSSNFEGGETYYYHFSDKADGSDLHPEFGGSLEAKEMADDGDDNDWIAILLFIIAALLLLIGIALIVVWLAIKGDKEIAEEWEE